MGEPTDAESMGTLANIERVLVADRCGVREALQAAYRLGELDGMLKIMKCMRGEGIEEK